MRQMGEHRRKPSWLHSSAEEGSKRVEAEEKEGPSTPTPLRPRFRTRKRIDRKRGRSTRTVDVSEPGSKHHPEVGHGNRG